MDIGSRHAHGRTDQFETRNQKQTVIFTNKKTRKGIGGTVHTTHTGYNLHGQNTRTLWAKQDITVSYMHRQELERDALDRCEKRRPIKAGRPLEEA